MRKVQRRPIRHGLVTHLLPKPVTSCGIESWTAGQASVFSTENPGGCRSLRPSAQDRTGNSPQRLPCTPSKDDKGSSAPGSVPRGHTWVILQEAEADWRWPKANTTAQASLGSSRAGPPVITEPVDAHKVGCHAQWGSHPRGLIHLAE